MKPVVEVRHITIEQQDLLTLLTARNLHLLKSLGELSSVSLSIRGNDLLVQGDESRIGRVKQTLDKLAQLVKSGLVPEEYDVRQAYRATAPQQAPEAEAEGGISSMTIAAGNLAVRAKSAAQADYLKALRSHDMIFVTGPAGTGKTYLAMAMAVAAFEERKFDRIILTRPAVEAGEKLGFLPGDLAQKVDPYLRPLYDALRDMMAPEQIERLMERGIIEVAPLAFMRGRTLNKAFVILDEAQNCTCEQMKMFLTRLGSQAKAVITGDITQIDLPRNQSSGLVQALQILRNIPEIAFCSFTEADVVRHSLVAKIVRAYQSASERASKVQPPADK